MSDPPVHRFRGRDGLHLAYREVGDGRPLLLVHGFLESALHWIHHGPVGAMVEHGHRVILPDLRGHGDSARPHAPAAYPPDVLADDGLALIEWLGLDNYDLGGYSLGGRIVLRMLVRGAHPARAIMAGQGLDALGGATRRTSGYGHLLTALANGDTIEPGSPDEEQARWIAQSGADPRALLHLLDTHVATPEAALRQVPTPTLVAIGDQDDRPSPDVLAELLPNARLTRVPGNHFTVIARPEFATAMLAFLDDHPPPP